VESVASLGFECPLATENPRIDFHREIKSGLDAQLLYQYLSCPTAICIPGLRDQLLDFCREWCNPASPLFGRIANIILEFDMLEVGELPPPAIFLALRRDKLPSKLSNDESYEVMTSGWKALTGKSASAELSAALRCCLEHCPPNAEVCHLGIMLSRSDEIARVNIRRLTYEQFVPYLESVGWRGPRGAFEKFLAEAFAYGEQVALAIDVGAQLGERIGLECNIGGDTFQWDPMFRHLVASGLATNDQREAMLKWPALIKPSDAPQEWPERLIMESLRRPSDQLGRLIRYLSHVKLSWHPQRPLTAKAYLGINHIWNKPGRPEIAQRWHDSIYPPRPLLVAVRTDSRELAIAKLLIG
jgi:hypothetical protein